MRKFEYLFIFLFIGVTIVLLLVPRKGLFKPLNNGVRIAKRRLGYFQVILLMSALISFVILMLVKFLIHT